MTGNSSTPLVKKPGIKEEMRLLILQPQGLQMLIRTCWKPIFTAQLCKPKERPDFIHLFVTSQKVFPKLFATIENA